MLIQSNLKHVTKYRPDIDGLRAFAVFSVIIFHIWPKILPGGFVGVDIFFVISGFLITTIITSEMTHGTFSFAKFYTRRIKRIMPLCWMVLIITSVIAWFVLLPGDLINFSGAARAVGMYASNIFFIKHNNYFALSSNEIPLLHTWSLSVEEQFYLIWPLLIFLVYKITNSIKALLITTVVITLFSLAFSIWCASQKVVFGSYGFGYYSILSRAYELSIGGFLALLIEKTRSSQIMTLTKDSLSVRVNTLAILGVLLLFYSIFFIDNGDNFPSYIALLPTIGTALLIYSGTLSHQCFVNRLLSHRYFVYVGLLSYSLYLFHWPILAYWHYENPGITPSFIQGMSILFITLVLSIIGYFFIELPVKRMQLSILSAIVILQVIPLISFSIIRDMVFKNNGYVARLDPSFRQEPNFFNSIKYDKGMALGGDLKQSPVKVLLVGDSHAEHFAPFWNMLALKYGFSMRFMYFKGCYPLMNHVNNNYIGEVSGSDECKQQIYNFTNQYKNYELIILAGRWGFNFADPENLLIGQKPDYPKGFNFESEIRYTISTLVYHNKKVIIMGDTPTDTTNNIDGYIRRKLFEHYSISNYIVSDHNLKFNLYDNKKTNDLMANISESYPDTYYFDFNQNVVALLPMFPLYESYLLYADFGHLNKRGSEILAQVYLNSGNTRDLKDKLTEWNIIKQ